MEETATISKAIKDNPRKALLPYYVAFGVVFFIVCLKVYAYTLSSAASLLASLTDSVGDLAISFISFLSLRYALRPADKEHRFGHGKAEGLVALFQACFLFGASIFLLFEAAHRFISPIEVSEHYLGVTVSGITILLTVGLVYVQNRIYRSVPSLALKADQTHYSSDIFLNASVIVALLADLWGGWGVLDITVAFFIAAFIIYSASEIAGEALDMLMDKEISDEDRAKIIEVVRSRDEVYGMHDLRTRKSGLRLFISFDIELDPELSLKQAHAIAHEIDLALLDIFPNAEIIIHKDPQGETDDPRHND
tara:strand:- start:695 stop:1618 length:924 start_codon:yes stop_codon:yes gene_type:complete